MIVFSDTSGKGKQRKLLAQGLGEIKKSAAFHSRELTALVAFC